MHIATDYQKLQTSLQIDYDLVDKFFSRVLKDCVVVLEPSERPDLLSARINREIRHQVMRFSTKSYYPFENAVEHTRNSLTPLVHLYFDALMAQEGYPLVFTDMSFLGWTKQFPNGVWPCFFLIDPYMSNTFAITPGTTWNPPSTSHFTPVIFPRDLLEHYYPTCVALGRAYAGSDKVLATGNLVPMTDWARKHLQRAEGRNIFNRFIIISAASNWLIASTSDLRKGIGGLKITDPIVVGRKEFRYNLGNVLGSITATRHYIITAYDPNDDELAILKYYTKSS